MSTEGLAGPGDTGLHGFPARSHELVRLSATEIAALDKHNAVVVQPIGSIEQHGPHLPVVTDAYIAETVVRAALERTVAEDAPVWMLPTLCYGRSGEHAGFGATVSLSTETLLSVLRDVGRSVAAMGFRRLVFVNGHGGNVALLDVVARDIRSETGLMVFRLMVSQLGLPDGLTCPDAEFAAHADFLETSVMLALDASMVGDERHSGGRSAARLFGPPSEGGPGIKIPTAWLTRDLSLNGVIGDPSTASAEVGAEVVDHWAQRLAQCYREIAQFDFGDRSGAEKE